MKKRKPPRCKECGKYAYPTRFAAVNGALGRVLRGARPLRIYRAHGGWHLTGQLKTEADRIREHAHVYPATRQPA